MQILTVNDIQQKQVEHTTLLETDFKRLKVLAKNVFFAAVIANLAFWILSSNSVSYELKISFYMISVTVVLFSVFMYILPESLKLVTDGRIMKSQYAEASPVLVHNCMAYINMPGMETWKEYVQTTQAQGRKLTSYECGQIIAEWNSLLKI